MGSGFFSKSSISFGETVATLIFGLGDGDGLTGDGEGDSSEVGAGASVGLGEGAGEDSFCFASGTLSFSGVGVGENLCLRWVVDFGEALGDGVGLLFRGFCRRLLGVGVGVVKNFRILSPNDGSSA